MESFRVIRCRFHVSCTDFITNSLSVEPLRFKLSCPVCHSQLGSMNIYYILYIILYIYIFFKFSNRKSSTRCLLM